MTTTLREHLAPGEAFCSWFVHGRRNEIVALVGTRDGIAGAWTAPLEPVSALIRDMEAAIVALTGDGRTPTDGTLTGIVRELGRLVVPDALSHLATGRSHRRVVLMPDGMIHALPFDYVIGSASGLAPDDVFPDGIVTCPNASTLAYCRRKRSSTLPARSAFLIGDRLDPDLADEVRAAAAAAVGDVSVVDSRSALELLGPVDLMYIATHGDSPVGTTAAGNHSDWTLEFDGGRLGADDFYSGRIRLAPGALVVLSACSVGRVLPGAAHELTGLADAIFYAGASDVVAARWPVLYEMAPLVFGRVAGEAATDRTSLGRLLRRATRDAMAAPSVRDQVRTADDEILLGGPTVLIGAGG